jgi:Tfp pilus assembly major pilin PilA
MREEKSLNQLIQFQQGSHSRDPKYRKMSKSYSSGFTFLELFIVIMIVVIATAIAIGIASDIQERSRITALLQFSTTIKRAYPIALLGEWKFEDNLDDTSDNNLNGFWIGVAGYTTHDASRQLGKAARFGGNNNIQVIDPGDDSILDIDSGITIEAWVKINDFWTNPWTCVLCKKDAYLLRIGKEGQANFSLCDELNVCHNNNPSQEVFEFETGKWYHYIGVWDGLKMKIFVNGEERGDPVDFTGRIDKNKEDLLIGENFIGLIDEVRIYNRGFSSAQIKKLYTTRVKELTIIE